jgi:hypothetical protein
MYISHYMLLLFQITLLTLDQIWYNITKSIIKNEAQILCLFIFNMRCFYFDSLLKKIVFAMLVVATIKKSF